MAEFRLGASRVTISAPSLPRVVLTTTIPKISLAPQDSTLIVVPVAGPTGPPSLIRRFNQDTIEAPDGVRVTFNMTENFEEDSLVVFLNGQRELLVTEIDSNTFVFDTAPFATDIIKMDFNLL